MDAHLLHEQVLSGSFIAYKTSNRMQLGQIIQKLRTDRKLSQKAVALSVGIDRGQYSRIENGKVEPTLGTLRKIAEALEISLGDFFADQQPLDINSFDKSLVDRLRLIDQLGPEQQQLVFSFIDALVANKKLKETLSTVLREVA